jgi:hypothetical protein
MTGALHKVLIEFRDSISLNTSWNERRFTKQSDQIKTQ